MEDMSFLQGGLENLKLIADNVWNVYDYDTEFRDIFANISRRESLISHRFESLSSADILSDLQYSIQDPTPTSRENCDDDIFDGEIFQLKDESENGVTYPYLNYEDSDNKIESAYWEDVKTVGSGRQAEINATFNNAFDPRLSFAGLGEDCCFLDDLEQDISVQHNVYMNVEDVADIVDEYHNKYRLFLNSLNGSSTEKAKVAKRILLGQPKKQHTSPLKAFDIKTCWKDEEERKLVDKLDTMALRNIWKGSNSVGESHNVIPEPNQVCSQPMTNVDAMTPSPNLAKTRTGRTPSGSVNKNIHTSNSCNVTTTTDSTDVSSQLPMESYNIWANVWSTGIHRDQPQDIAPGMSLHSQNIQNVEEGLTTKGTSKAFSETSVVHDDGKSIPVLTSTRHQDRDRARAKSMRSESSLTKIGASNLSTVPKLHSPRETTQSSFVEGGFYSEVSKNPARGRSEIFPKESDCVHLQTGLPSLHHEPEISKIPILDPFSWISKNPARGQSEIFPKESDYAQIQPGLSSLQHEPEISKVPISDPFSWTSKNTAWGQSEIAPKESDYALLQPGLSSLHHEPETSKVPISDPFSWISSNRAHELSKLQSPSSSESKFHNALKRYGWYKENFDTKPTTETKDTQGVMWPYSFGQVCEPSNVPYQATQSDRSVSSKRQLFRSPSPTKAKIKSHNLDNRKTSPQKRFDHLSSLNFSRSRSTSPSKRFSLHNNSMNTQTSSPNLDSSISSLMLQSPEPAKTASQLNAASEPFIPAHLKSHPSPLSPSPTKSATLDFSSKQKNCQSPNHDALKRLLQSPEVLVSMVASNDAKQAYLIQQKQQQIQQQPPQQALSQVSFKSNSNVHPKPSLIQTQSASNGVRRETGNTQRPPIMTHKETPLVQSHQTNMNMLSQKTQPPHISYTSQQFQVHHQSPFTQTNTFISQWPCSSVPPPPPSRYLGVNFAFKEPRPRTVPLPQRYVPPVFTWQAIPSFPPQTIPSFPPQTRVIHHQVFNMNNNCGSFDDTQHTCNSSNSGYQADTETKNAPAPPSRTARPIKANPANLIHISTKSS